MTSLPYCTRQFGDGNFLSGEEKEAYKRGSKPEKEELFGGKQHIEERAEGVKLRNGEGVVRERKQKARAKKCQDNEPKHADIDKIRDDNPSQDKKRNC